MKLRELEKPGTWLKCTHPSDYGLIEGKLYRVRERYVDQYSGYYKVYGDEEYGWFHGRFVKATWWDHLIYWLSEIHRGDTE